MLPRKGADLQQDFVVFDSWHCILLCYDNAGMYYDRLYRYSGLTI